MSSTVATRSSWKNAPMGPLRECLGLEESFTSTEMDNIRRGLVPHEMDDKWFAFFEGNRLYVHRSWSGVCAYEVEFSVSPDGDARVNSAWTNRSIDWYGQRQNEDFEVGLLRWIIHYFLLHDRSFPFPERR